MLVDQQKASQKRQDHLIANLMLSKHFKDSGYTPFVNAQMYLDKANERHARENIPIPKLTSQVVTLTYFSSIFHSDNYVYIYFFTNLFISSMC